MCAVSHTRHTEARTVEPLIPEPSGFEAEVVVVENLKGYKLLGFRQITLKFIQAKALLSLNISFVWDYFPGKLLPF